MTSETQQFSGLAGSFTLSYEYTTGALLKKVTDPTGASISYDHDAAGRLVSVSGSLVISAFLFNAEARSGLPAGLRAGWITARSRSSTSGCRTTTCGARRGSRHPRRGRAIPWASTGTATRCTPAGRSRPSTSGTSMSSPGLELSPQLAAPNFPAGEISS